MFEFNRAHQAEVDALWQDHGDDIVVLNTIAHLRILSLPYTGAAGTLARRQREVQAWVEMRCCWG